VAPGDELMLITSTGTLVRTPVADISTMGRNTQGVRLIRLDEADRLVGISRVEPLPDDEGGPVDGGPVDGAPVEDTPVE